MKRIKMQTAATVQAYLVGAQAAHGKLRVLESSQEVPALTADGSPWLLDFDEKAVIMGCCAIQGD